MLISICIPTFNRPDLLKQAVDSCLSQAYRPFELIIGDDSTNLDTKAYVESLTVDEGILLRYLRNDPSLGQSGNVNRLFDNARGEKLIILHDDDVFVPGGLDVLMAGLAADPTAQCVYGMQSIIAPDGTDLPTDTETWNLRYFRVDHYAGAQKTALLAALWQQVPNNAYLMDSVLAKAVRYRQEDEIGQCVDADFVIRVAMAYPAARFVYVPQFVSKYRLTPNSIARSQTLNRRQDLFYEFVKGIATKSHEDSAKDLILTRIGTGASLDAAMAYRPLYALMIIFSRYYSLPFWGRSTFFRFVCVISPKLGAWIKRGIKQVIE